MPRVRRKAFQHRDIVPEDSAEEHHNEVNYYLIDWLVRRAFLEPLKLRHNEPSEQQKLAQTAGYNMYQLLGTVHVLSASEALPEEDQGTRYERDVTQD